MKVKVEFVEGPNLHDSLYVGSSVDETGAPIAGVEQVVVRADYVLHPSVVSAVGRIAASEGTREEKLTALAALPVQPERYVEYFSTSCKTLEDFQQMALHLATNHGQLKRTAEKGATGEAPKYATEPREKVKVGDEPMVAAESTYVPDKGPAMEAAGDPRKFFQRLPTKAVGEPERAIDVNSSVAPELAILSAELKKSQDTNLRLQAELDQKKAEEGHAQIISLMTETGAVEDAKDKDKVAKVLMGLDEKGLGAVETLLKMVRDAKGKAPAGGKPAGGAPPKPGAPAGGKPPAKPDGMPAMSSAANLVHASMPSAQPVLSPSSVGMGSDVAALQTIWLSDDAGKALKGMRH